MNLGHIFSHSSHSQAMLDKARQLLVEGSMNEKELEFYMLQHLKVHIDLQRSFKDKHNLPFR